MGIGHRLLWANLFLGSYEEEYMSLLISSDKIKAGHFHSTKRFIDDDCAINDGGELLKEGLFVIYVHKSLSLRLKIRIMMLMNLDMTIFIVHYEPILHLLLVFLLWNLNK